MLLSQPQNVSSINFFRLLYDSREIKIDFCVLNSQLLLIDSLASLHRANNSRNGMCPGPGCQKVEHIRTNLYNLLSSSIESSHPSLNSNRYKYPTQAVTVKLFLFAFYRLLDFFSDWLALRLLGAQNRSAVGIKRGIIVKHSDRTRTERIDEVQWGFFHQTMRPGTLKISP